MNTYEIWMEGFAATGQSGAAHRVMSKEGKDLWEGDTFQEACEAAAKELRWGHFYDKERSTYWSCKLFDNEADARKSFG